MTLPSGSILVTPGSGATIAAHLVSSKKNEVFLTANESGSLDYEPGGVYAVHTKVEANSEGFSITQRNRLSILNADASLIVDVLSVWAHYMNDTASTRIGTRVRLSRSTAHSGGTLMAPQKLDSASGALDADITVRLGTDLLDATVTRTGENLSACFFPAVQTALSERISLWNARLDGGPVVLRQNEGVSIFDVSESSDQSASYMNYGIIFRVR